MKATPLGRARFGCARATPTWHRSEHRRRMPPAAVNRCMSLDSQGRSSLSQFTGQIHFPSLRRSQKNAPLWGIFVEDGSKELKTGCFAEPRAEKMSQTCKFGVVGKGRTKSLMYS